MTKIIIDNRSDLELARAINMVKRVLFGGRCSDGGKAYCYMTIFTSDSGEYSVAARRNTTSDTFIVSNYPGVNHDTTTD